MEFNPTPEKAETGTRLYSMKKLKSTLKDNPVLLGNGIITKVIE